MFKLHIRQHRAAACLLVAGTVVLLGTQQVLGTAASAETTQAIVDVHELRPLTASASTAPVMVNAAVSMGQFEDVVKPTPVPTVAPTQPTIEPTVEPTPAPPEPEMSLFESGIASTYGEGDGFEGNRTACGQVFHTQVVQIAHKTLPCGTYVRVEDTSTGRTVDAQVTDRGPYVAGRVVDLSWGAFQQLDPTGPGLLHVNLYVLDQ